MIRIEAMLCENLVIGGEDGAKREVVNIGGLLRGGDDLVQDFDVWSIESARLGAELRYTTRLHS